MSQFETRQKLIDQSYAFPTNLVLEGDNRISRENLLPLSEVRQIKDIDRGGIMITHINGVALRILESGIDSSI